MKKIISISETLQIPHSAHHAIATADAFYNEENGELEVQSKVVQLDDEETRVEAFAPQTTRTKVDLEEAIPAAKDIFHTWVKKILKTGLVEVEK